MRSVQHTTSGTVRAGVLAGSLRPRVVGFAESLSGLSWFVVLIESGTVRFAGEDFGETGPVLSLRPWNREARATFQAGTTATYLIIGPTALANAVGHIPESRDLRELADHPVTVQLSAAGTAFPALRAAFLGISRELEMQQAAGHAVVEAYLRVILVETYRAGRSQLSGTERAAPSQGVFAKYGALVEAHFREHWSVNRYAEALGVSRDRLGDVCRRVRGLGPKVLIDRRIALEARLQLENSSNTIQQIAEVLGFSSAAQFSRFFQRTVGKPPGAYRRSFLEGAHSGAMDPARPYDWP